MAYPDLVEKPRRKGTNISRMIGFCYALINPANPDKSGICCSLFSAGCGVF